MVVTSRKKLRLVVLLVATLRLAAPPWMAQAPQRITGSRPHQQTVVPSSRITLPWRLPSSHWKMGGTGSRGLLMGSSLSSKCVAMKRVAVSSSHVCRLIVCRHSGCWRWARSRRASLPSCACASRAARSGQNATPPSSSRAWPGPCRRAGASSRSRRPPWPSSASSAAGGPPGRSRRGSGSAPPAGCRRWCAASGSAGRS